MCAVPTHGENRAGAERRMREERAPEGRGHGAADGASMCGKRGIDDVEGSGGEVPHGRESAADPKRREAEGRRLVLESTCAPPARGPDARAGARPARARPVLTPRSLPRAVSSRWSKQRENWLQPGPGSRRKGDVSWTGLSLMELEDADFSLNAVGRYPRPIPLTELVDHLGDRWCM